MDVTNIILVLMIIVFMVAFAIVGTNHLNFRTLRKNIDEKIERNESKIAELKWKKN